MHSTMANPKRVAIVTGGNKGIGFAIVKGLCERWRKGDVYLTARDETRGRTAVEDLKKLGLDPIYHQLDISDESSIKRLRDHIAAKYGKIDILVNNAAVYQNENEPFGRQAEHTTFVNYFSLLSVCNMLFPLLIEGSRVVNLSSSAGHLHRIPGEDLRKRFADGNLTEQQLSDLMHEFVESSKNGTNMADGWGSSPYVVTKVGVSALTFIHDRKYGPRGIFVNCVHPGYVDTDMTLHTGPLTIEQGAVGPLCLALDEENKYKGVYMWEDCSLVDWYSVLPKNYARSAPLISASAKNS